MAVRDPEARRAYQRAWAAANRERVNVGKAASGRRRYLADPESHRSAQRARRLADPGKARAADRRKPSYGRKRATTDARNAASLRWRTANRERERELARRRRAAEPERSRRQLAQWLRRSAAGSCTVAQLAARWAVWGGLCWLCGAPATCTDHVKPLAKGGSNWPANLRPACQPCNGRKRDRWPVDTGKRAPL